MWEIIGGRYWAKRVERGPSVKMKKGTDESMNTSFTTANVI